MTVLDLFQLRGKVAVVTGASSGLGVAAAQALAEAGADVALGARRADRLADTSKLVEAAGRRALAVKTDVRSPDACKRLVDRPSRHSAGSTSSSTTPAWAPASPLRWRRPSNSDPFSRST